MIRIISDIHYGDKASGVVDLNQLLPLFEGANSVIFNGDTLDTRHGPNPLKTAQDLAQMNAFLAGLKIPITCITGNHDPDFSSIHHLNLAQDQVFVMHGDLAFDSIVPWGKDAPMLRKQIKDGLERLGANVSLEEKLSLYRRLSKDLPQGHQAEKNSVKYAAKFLKDTAWPPWRLLYMLNAWRCMPKQTAQISALVRPRARFVITGHTHWPGVWKTKQGITVINTGSFCPPLGQSLVELNTDLLVVRSIKRKNGSYYPGKRICEFLLAH